MTNNDKQRQTMTNNDKQWPKMTKSDTQWQSMTNNNKQLQTKKNNDKQRPNCTAPSSLKSYKHLRLPSTTPSHSLTGELLQDRVQMFIFKNTVKQANRAHNKVI